MRRALPAIALASGLVGQLANICNAAPPIPGAQSRSGLQELIVGQLVVSNRHIALPPITVSELSPRNPVEPRSATDNVTSRGAGLHFDGDIDPPALTAVVRRELRDLWRYAPEPGRRNDLVPPRIRVELRSQDGRLGYLSSLSSALAHVAVEIRVTVDLRQGPNGERWYEGSVVLEIPVAGFAAAGTYSGRIELIQESV